jgi:hypothetical protein
MVIGRSLDCAALFTRLQHMRHERPQVFIGAPVLAERAVLKRTVS